MEKIFKNIQRAAGLQEAIFEEAANIPELSSHSAAAILLSSAAAGIGSMGKIGIPGILLGTFGALASWIVWIAIVYFSSLVVLPGSRTKSFSTVDFLRVSGFASSPGLIRMIGIIGPLHPLTTTVSYLWMIAAMAMAVKQVAGHKTLTESALISAGSWIVMYFIITILLSSRVF